MNTITEFIERRWRATDGNFLNGNCYWFAQILCTQFNGLQLYYNPIEGHFVAGDSDSVYDWLGQHKKTDSYLLFSDLLESDPLWGARILRDCRD